MRFSQRILNAEGHWLMGRVLPHQLLEGIGSHLSLVAPGRTEELVRAVSQRAGQLAELDRDLAVDGAAEGMVAMSAVLLAAFEMLRVHFEDDDRRTILFLQHVFGEVLKRSMEIVIEALVKRDAPLETVASAITKSSGLYGSYFHFEFERPDAATFEMRVTRCLFRDFFARHNATMVTTVLCAWDANWMQALDPAVGGLRAERTSLLSLGDDACRFRVLRTEDPLAQYVDVLQGRFTDNS